MKRKQARLRYILLVLAMLLGAIYAVDRLAHFSPRAPPQRPVTSSK